MAKPLTKTEFLTYLKTDIHKHNKVVSDVFKPLDEDQLNWRPNPKEWNILQCFDHLNLTHEYYLPKIKQAFSNPKIAVPGQDIYKPSFWGRIYMYFAFNPKYSFPTAEEITPQAGASQGVFNIYLAKQETLVEILEQVGEIDLRRTPVPLEKGVKFNLGDCLKVLVYHDDLHIEQAKGILAAMQPCIDAPSHADSRLRTNMTINPQRVEEISLNAWPALQHVLYDGWLLRLSKGYTKRANSVNPLYPSSLDLEKKVAYCEEFYTARSLKPVFRLTPFSSPPDLDDFLEHRGYQVLDQTLVMVLDLENLDIQTEPGTGIFSQDIDDWMEIFYQVSPASLADYQVHQEILTTISMDSHLVALQHTGAYLACGLGVLEAEYAGLFDIVTDPEARRRGYGTRIVLAVLDWAREQGARYSYLQVVKGNFPARKLYEKIGFKELYRYWYRVLQKG